MCISHNIASSFHCHMCRLEFKMPLPPAKKQKTLACIREIQVLKLCTKVYSQKWLTQLWTQVFVVVLLLHIVSSLVCLILPCLFLVHGEVGKKKKIPFLLFYCETGSLISSLFDWRLSWFLFSFADKPQPPRGPFEASEIDGESMTLTWQPPKDDGGEPVANYIVEKRKAGTNRWTKVSSFCHSPKCQVGHCCVGLLSAPGYSSFIVADNSSSHLSCLVFALCLALI